MQQEILPQCPMQPSYCISIKQQHEYRIYFNDSYDKNLEVTLVQGQAEIFGHEMTQYKTYEFKPGTNFFIYTWQGCEIKTNIKDEYFYESSNSDNLNDHPLVVIANISLYLNELRKQALEQQKLGPRVLITGQQQSGKSTVEKILVNYGCKLGWQPLLVDLDQSNNEILCGGCIAASQIKYSYPESFVEESQKIVYFNGQTKVDGKDLKKQLYKKSIQQLRDGVFQKLNKNLNDFQSRNQLNQQQYQFSELFVDKQEQIFASGIIVNVPHFQEEVRKELLPLIIEYYQIDTIVVVGHEFQFNTLSRQYQRKLNVLFCNKLGAVMENDNRERYLMQKNDKLLQQYFKGLNSEINSTTFTFPIKDLKLYYFDQEVQAGEISVKVKKWDISNLSIVKKVVGILHYKFQSEQDAVQDDEDYLTEQFMRSPLMILAHIDSIFENDKVKLLLPLDEQPEDICLHPFIIGNLNWVGQK